MMKGALAIVLVVVAGGLAWAAEVTRDETLPASGDGLIPVDLWTFYCPAGGSATVTVDTLGVPAGATTSALDPALHVLHDQYGMSSSEVVASGDDEIECTVPPACGFDCPQVTFNCDGDGEHTIRVFTFYGEGSPPCGTEPGWYRLAVEVFDNLNGTGTPLPEAEVRLGGEAVRRGFVWGYLPAGPAYDDVLVDLTSGGVAASGTAAQMSSPLMTEAPVTTKIPVRGQQR